MSLNSREGWLREIAARPHDVALVLIDGDGQRLAHRDDQPQPLASTVKVLHVAAFAAAAEEGCVDVRQRFRVGDWEAYDLPGMDGGAHVGALDALGIPRTGTSAEPDVTASFAALLRALVVFSDNSAADYLYRVVGVERLLRAARDVGWEASDPGLTLGDMLVLLTGSGDDVGCRRVALGHRLAARYHHDVAFRQDVQRRAAGGERPGYDARRSWAEGSYAASAREVAALMGAVGRLEFVSPAASLRAQRQLEQTLPVPAPPGAAGVGFKGGFMSGVVTAAMNVRWISGQVAVGVLLLRGLPAAAVAEAAGSAAHVALLRSALLHSSWRRRLAAAVV